MKILIVDDQRSARKNLTALLDAFDFVQHSEAATLDDARRALEQQTFDLALVDIRLSEDARDRSGLTLIREIIERTNCVPVCVTASGEMDTIRAAMRVGAYDYLLKDGLCEEVLAPLLEGLRARRRLEREVIELRARVATDVTIPGILGTSPAMERLREKIRRVAVADKPALILGPTGSGKELVARALHALGPHPDAPLIDLNCGAIPPSLIESHLFGHVRGAFTGADRPREGAFAAVGEGTLFLDEVAELPIEMQPRLLRVLETRTFYPVGTESGRSFHGRVVAATHANITEMVAKRQFREDLYYRLQVLELRVPPLAERVEDIPLLVAHFCKSQRRALRFTPEALQALLHEEWPGNVRQLRNLIDRVAVFADSEEITPSELNYATERSTAEADDALRRHVRAVLQIPDVSKRLLKTERTFIEEALRMCDQNKSAAARLLGVHRKYVERRSGPERWDDREDDED